MSHAPLILSAGRISKSASDHISVQVVQRVTGVFLLQFIGLVDRENLSNLFFHLDATCRDGSVACGREWLDSTWMPDTSLHGASIRDMSWFVGFRQELFPRV